MKRYVLFVFALMALVLPSSLFAEEPAAPEAPEAAATEEQPAPVSEEAMPKPEIPKSSHGSHEWQFSWGGGVEYGVMFTALDRWNTHLFEPTNMSEFDNTIVGVHDLAFEVSPVEGLRITAFGGYASSYSSDPGLDFYYFGIEPAFAVRRGFFEFAAGAGAGYGGASLSNGSAEGDASLLLIRPFIEGRWYPDTFMAIYARAGFHLLQIDDFDSDQLEVVNTEGRPSSSDLLSEAGPYLALGLRFGDYPEHVKNVPDTDGDGWRDDVDSCPDKVEDLDGFEDHDGCPEDDNDGDGIPDETDQCKLVAEDLDGWMDEDGCPENDDDRDGDGILDVVDQCPDKAEDKDNWKDTDGCPEEDDDRDGDGVLDVNDKCPLKPGKAANNGCPRVLVAEEKIEILEKIHFALGKAEIMTDSDALLAEIAQVIIDNPRIKKIEIQGHTDHSGRAKKNLKLSGQRAEAVFNRLVELGVEAERLSHVGYGSNKPLIPLGEDGEETEEEAAQNRRVEFLILEQDETFKEVAPEEVKPGTVNR